MSGEFVKLATPTESGVLRFLYNNPFGRVILRLLRARWVSAVVGGYMDTALSKPLIKGFMKNNNINAEDYYCDNFRCFNDAFTRQIKEGKRPVSGGEEPICPCDGLLSVYEIKDGLVMPIKQSAYSVESLLKNRELSEEFREGYAYVFRLCVDNYHRYVYPVDGEKGENIFINGTLHTVRPIALEKTKVFCENAREYTVIQTEKYGKFVQIEIGAMLVGRINNHHGKGECKKGEEKGMFLYGGSTIVLLTQKGICSPDRGILQATSDGFEIPVEMGEMLNLKSREKITV